MAVETAETPEKKPKGRPKQAFTKAEREAIAAGEQELELKAAKSGPGTGIPERVKWNPGQKRVMKALENKDVREALIASGARSGKTYLIISIVVTRAVLFPESRHLIARKWFAHAKGSIWLDTLPKVLQALVPELKPVLYWSNTDYFVRFPNGAEIWIAGLDDKEKVDKILGREYMTIFFNEASEINYDVYTTVKTRLAQRCERRYTEKTSRGNPDRKSVV